MSKLDHLQTWAGSWVGQSTLHKSWLEKDLAIVRSDSTLELRLADHYGVVDYTWQEDSTQQQGTLMFTVSDEGEASGAWTDTWHSTATLMTLSGAIDPEGVLRLTGAYAAGDGPDWAWRIELESINEVLQMRMINIDPDGAEEWAVQADYSRPG